MMDVKMQKNQTPKIVNKINTMYVSVCVYKTTVIRSLNDYTVYTVHCTRIQAKSTTFDVVYAVKEKWMRLFTR